jgi:hypothetical protein
VDWIHLAGYSEHGSKPSASIKGEDFLEYLSDYQLLNKKPSPWNELF